jgi:ligand-binding sensor domain-containing protein/signal transduction histidine kinase
MIAFLSSFTAADNHRYTFRQLTVEDGLSQTTVLCILQDKKGFMWFGTGNGLNKYDGYNFRIFTSIIDDSTSLSSNAINSIFEDSKGRIWVGTVDGVLNRFNRETETFTRYNITSGINLTGKDEEQLYDFPVSFSRNNNNSLTTIAEDNSGNLWVGTWGKGVIYFDPQTGNSEHFYKGKGGENSISNNKITSIIKDSDGSILVGTLGGGLNRITEKDKSFYFHNYLLSGTEQNSNSNRVISLFQDDEKYLWIGTYGGGLKKGVLSGNKIKFTTYSNIQGKNSISSNTVMSVVQDRYGFLWIATFGGGLDRFDSETETFLNFRKNKFDDNSLADNDVLTLYEDRSGILWIGTNLGRGISKLERNKIKFNHLKNSPAENSLNDDVVWSIYKDKEVLWIGTYRGGLNKIGNKKFQYYQNKPGDKNSISDNHIRSITKDNFGNLWIGTFSGGLNLFNSATEKFKSYKNDPADPKSIGANQVLSILPSPDSIFWVGTFGGGLNYFKYSGSDNITFSKYVNDPGDTSSLSDNRVYSVYRTNDGTIWAGTFGGGLNKFDAQTGKFKRFMADKNSPESISHDRIMSIYEDSRGRMWISTYGGGLNLFDRKTEKFKVYTRKDGLLSDVIYGVLEDNSGNLWISSDNGLFKLYTESERFIHYDTDDGLQSLEFSGGAYFKSESGELFFGGINGVSHFHPDSISENSHMPPVVITSIKIAGQQYQGEVEELQLDYNQNILTFEFSALDFTNPLDNHYEYMLEGLETEWQLSDAKYRLANYTNLSPGTYYFKVRGSNNDELWNNEAAVIKIIIDPPYWKTWWFIAGVIFLAALTIYYLSTIRIRNLLAIEKLKTKLAADLHDNIGAGLTEISILSELASNTLSTLPENYSGNLKTISETARQLVDNMSDIVWVVNPKRDSLHDLIIRLKETYADVLSGMGIALKTYNLEKIEDVKLPMEYKQNLFMILKEGMNNSIKHSGCRKITLEANVRNDVIEITLKDDGVGLPENAIIYGNGLKNLEYRAAALGAKVKWRSAPGEGTTIIFLGKIKRSIRNRLQEFRVKN